MGKGDNRRPTQVDGATFDERWRQTFGSTRGCLGRRPVRCERQYRITKAQVERLAQALEQLRDERNGRAGVHPRLVQAEQEALRSQLSDLEAELAEYAG